MVTESKRCLSDFWRIDRSSDRVMELVSVLQGADSLIGVMGSGVRAVWSTNGESQTWWVRWKEGKPLESRVFLDYTPLAQLRPPFEGQAVDEVIGYAAHEGGHCLWSSADGRQSAISIMANRPGKTRAASSDRAKVEEVLRVANIIEDAFIDYHVGEEWPVLGEYIRWSRRKIHEARPIDLDAIARQVRPSRNAMRNLWVACSLYDQDPPARKSARVRKALDFLLRKSVEAVKTQQAHVRMELAVECWELLEKEFPTAEEPLPRKPKPPQPPQGKGEKDEGEGGGDVPVPSSGGQQAGEGEKEEEADQEGEGGDQGGEEAGQESDEGGGEGGGDEGEAGQESGEADQGGEAGDTKESDQGQGGEARDEDEGEGEEAGQESADEGEGEDKGDEGQEHGHFSSEKEAETASEGEDKEADRSSQQGGDEQGAPGDLDDMDIRDIEEVPAEVWQEVMDAIAHEREDLSRSVAEVVNRPYSSVKAETKKADFDGPAAEKVRSQVEKQVQEMRRVFDRQAAVQSRNLMGLSSGKLHARSLARVGTGNMRVFQRREVLEQPDLAVGLLLDVSGSMNHWMGVVWMTAAVFGEGLVHKPGVNFLCLTYTGGMFQVQTTRVCDREMGKLCLGNVEQGGGTPSGPALASMKVLMERMPERQKVILHFTDGRPDDGDWSGRSPSVTAAVEACRKAGFQVWAIAPTGYEAMLQSQYGEGNYETIGTIAELPAKVAALVKNLVGAR